MHSSNPTNPRHSMPIVSNDINHQNDQRRSRLVYNSLQDHQNPMQYPPIQNRNNHQNVYQHAPPQPLARTARTTSLSQNHHSHDAANHNQHDRMKTQIQTDHQYTRQHYHHTHNNNMVYSSENYNYKNTDDQQMYHSHIRDIHTELSNSPPLPPYPPTRLPRTTDNQKCHPKSYVDQVIYAILLAKSALFKPIVERDERDILLIDELCSLLHGFNRFPKTIRRALAAQAQLIVIEETGKELILNDEELDSFCVLTFGECELLDAGTSKPVRSYIMGDAFGVCEPTTETIRFVGILTTKNESCAFLCVKRDDFYTILTDPANLPKPNELDKPIRHRDQDGIVECVSVLNVDRESTGPTWFHNMQYSNRLRLPDSHIIIKANLQRLLMSLVDGYDNNDEDYIDDFLLLYRVFMPEDPKEHNKLPPGIITLCRWLLNCFDNCIEYRDKIVKIILRWLDLYFSDFEIDPEFSYLFFEDFAVRLKEWAMKDHLRLLYSTLSAKSKVRNVTISKSTEKQPLGFEYTGGYHEDCGIFVTRSDHSTNYPYNSLTNYLNHLSPGKNVIEPPPVPPRNRSQPTTFNHQEGLKNLVVLRPGDQILMVNGISFQAIMLEDAQLKLEKPTHLSIDVKYNPYAFHELRSSKDGRRKPSSQTCSSALLPTNGCSKFTFNNIDSSQSVIMPIDHTTCPSPLFTATNSGFISKISSIFNQSRSFVQQMKESHLNHGNVETISRASDNISDNQSNDVDMGKTKSNPELTCLRTKDYSSNLGERASIAQNSYNNNAPPMNVVRVFNDTNNDAKYFLISEETTARELVTKAVKEFNLIQPQNNISSIDKVDVSQEWTLYEVSIDPESKSSKRQVIPDRTTKLADRSPLCSRYYIRNKLATADGSSKSCMDTDNVLEELVRDSPLRFPFESLNATLLAEELTKADFDKFKAIEPQQYVYSTFFNYSKSKPNDRSTVNGDTASLRSSSSDGQDQDVLRILNRSRIIPASWMKEFREFDDQQPNVLNKEMFWVVCEILNERNHAKRVKIIKQFIRVADVCFQLRNYNSMFAIISGLEKSSVSRLKRSFDKLKPKYKEQLDKMIKLFDVSRNMSNYRKCLRETSAPAIPLFSLIKKDLTFTKEGRYIFVRESNELSDDEDGSGSQDTIRRRVSKTSQFQQPTTDLHTHTSFNYINHTTNGVRDHRPKGDTVLINFAEIRKFACVVRDVTHYSSSPYPNDSAPNTKEKSPSQLKKMHDEGQMRKRIRYYLNVTLINPLLQESDHTKSSCVIDQVDSGCSSSCSSTIVNPNDLKLNQNGRLIISYDEHALHQRSLEIEPEYNQTQARGLMSERSLSAMTVQANYNNNQQVSQPSTPLLPDTVNPIQPLEVSMQRTYIMANHSPTLSKSSSLSSTSSFIPPIVPGGYLAGRNNLGKFGTESTEGLRKLQGLINDDHNSARSKGPAASRMFQSRNQR